MHPYKNLAQGMSHIGEPNNCHLHTLRFLCPDMKSLFPSNPQRAGVEDSNFTHRPLRFKQTIN